MEQGYDLKLDDGWLRLVNGEEVRLLRTWRDRRFEDTVKYSFFSRDNTLWFWNVYKRQWPKGSITEEKWTGNAGFWIEEAVGGKRIYHCSHGMSPTPNFESLVVEIRIEKFGVL